MNSLITTNSDILAFALRYALERKTTSASIVVDQILRCWDSLQRWEQDQIQREIHVHLEGNPHPQAWKDVWKQIQNLTVKPLPEFAV